MNVLMCVIIIVDIYETLFTIILLFKSYKRIFLCDIIESIYA